MSNKRITKQHCITKNLFQCLLILIEFGGISFAFVCLTDHIVPCETFIDYLERATLGLALYEFLVFVLLEAINDARKDSFIALQTIYAQAILACEEDSDVLYTRVDQVINGQLKSSMLNSTNIRQEYEILRILMERRDIIELKYRQTIIDNELNAADLRWRFTLLLRLFK